MFEAMRNPCPRCGTVPRTTSARFCTRCGMALAAGPTAAPPAAIVAPPPPPAYPPGLGRPSVRSAPPKAKSKSGCGCLFLILIVLFVIVGAGIYSTRRAKSPSALRSELVDSVSVPAYVPAYAAPKRVGSPFTGLNYVQVARSENGGEGLRCTASVQVDQGDRAVTVVVYPAFVGADQPLQQYNSPFTNGAGQIAVGRRLAREGPARATEVQVVQMDLPASLLFGWPRPLEARFVLYDDQGREVDRKVAAIPGIPPYGRR
ncbi:MAG TPA: hypothetical protein VF796_13935 [Humisphaera sp.]